MAEKEGSVSNIYQGGYSSLNPSYGDVFRGYRVSAGSLGLTTNFRTANVLQEVSSKLSTGVKQIEISTVSPEVFESIPEQHLKEVNRLSKLTGVDISVHAPIIEPSGISKEGFSETNRESVERQMFSAVERSHKINPQGNIPVTFHSSAIIPQPVTPKGKKQEEFYVIDSERGSIHKIPIRERKFPGEAQATGTSREFIQKELNVANEEQWSKNIVNLSHYAERGKEAIREYGLLARAADAERKAGKELTKEEERAESYFEFGENFLNDSYRNIKDLFELANRYGSDKDKKILSDFSKRVESKVEQINKSENVHEKISLKEDIIDEGIKTFKGITAPEILQPLDDFAQTRTAQTFANVAFNSYGKFKGSSPIISIENPPAGMAFSTGEELKKIVEDARDKFTDRMVKEKGMSEKEARAAAEKILGVTWDVGHINMIRKYGYGEKDVVKETEQVAPLVKHVHLSDNFGFEHTELPMGMGNVPIKEMLKMLPEKDVKKIIEAGSWWQHFKTAPVKETFEALGSPIYPMSMAPYWNQSLGLQQGYFSGYGQMLPQMNYETFGAGFSQLPSELGGQRPGAGGSRMSGKGME